MTTRTAGRGGRAFASERVRILIEDRAQVAFQIVIVRLSNYNVSFKKGQNKFTHVSYHGHDVAGKVASVPKCFRAYFFIIII